MRVGVAIAVLVVGAGCVGAGCVGAGCGGGGASDDDGGDDDDGGAVDAAGDGGGEVDRDRWRFSSDTVASDVFGGSIPVALALGEPVRVGYGAVVAARGGGGWAPETLPASGVVDLAVAGGTVWALLDSSGDLSVAHAAGGGPWTVEDLRDASDGGSMAVGADGTVYVAFGGGGSSTAVPRGLVLARRSNDAWTYQSVAAAPTNVPEYVDVAIVGGEPWIAWQDDNAGSLKLSTSSGGTFTTETIDANVPSFVDHQLALAVDAAGRPHVAYRQNSIGAREIDYAVRDGGTWTLETAVVQRNGARGDVRLALSPAGAPTIAYLDSQGIGLATRDAAGWFSQPLIFDDQATVDLAYDAAGTLQVALSARDEIRLFTRAGTFPADYDATCATIAATLCPLACACNTDCCIGNAAGLNTCARPLDFCEYVLAWQACGDASQDPSLTSACAAAAPTAACSSDPLLLVPDACTQF